MTTVPLPLPFAARRMKIQSMKCLFFFAAIALLVPVESLCAQTRTVAQEFPVDVVRNFMKIETTGGRLTPEGWNKASTFFIRPDSYPDIRHVHVILNDQADYAEEIARSQNWAEVAAGMNEVGQLDAKLRFEPAPEPTRGIMVKEGPSIRFDLVLTDEYWQLEPDGIMSRALKGPPEWKIVNESPNLCITIDAAIRYVKGARAKANDPMIRKNADNTLAALKRLQHPTIEDRPSACACD